MAHEKLQRLGDAVFDGLRRRPAETPDPRRVEEDARAIADPAALAARVLDLRRHAHRAGDDPDALVDIDPVVLAEVEDVDGLARLLDRDEDRRDAVADVQVALLLLAVAEHLEPRGIAAQLAPEVHDVPVRVPRPED